MLFVSRRKYERDLAAERAEQDRLRSRVLTTEARFDEVEGKRRNLARWLAEAEAANKRLAGRNTRLAELLTTAREAQDDQAIEHIHDRLDRALRAVVRWRADAADARQVSRFLGEQLLSAVGADYTPVQRAAVGLPAGESEEVKAS